LRDDIDKPARQKHSPRRSATMGEARRGALATRRSL